MNEGQQERPIEERSSAPAAQVSDKPVLEVDVNLRVTGFRIEVQTRLGPSAAVLGPSGAGKSVLLEVIAGLRWAEGTVRVGGRLLQDSDSGLFLPPERRQLGYVPQDGALFPHLSVRRNLLYGRTSSLRPRRPTAKERQELDRLVEALELGDLMERMPSGLSGGEMRRVALGRALLAHPRLLLLDEPTTGLDPRRARQARALIQRLRDDLEVPMLIVTHQPEDARALAREVLLLDSGRVQAQGPTETVLRRPEVLLRWPEWGGENQVEATVLAHDAEGGVTRVALDGGGEIAVPLLEALDAGDSLMLAVGAEEVLLATEKPQGLSARNMLETAVDEIVPVGSTIYVRAGRWFARLTPAAVAELDLAVGARVWLVVKTHSWRVVSG